ncbi:MAG: FG-GAP repeat domain-containing protein [Mycobacteriales bacterium]
MERSPASAGMCAPNSKTAIVIGIGDGTFWPPALITEPNISIPHYQAVADFNLDGFQDLALSLGDVTFDLMEILNGNGNGTFQSPVMFLKPPPKSSSSGFAVVATDFNGDTKADIACAAGVLRLVGCQWGRVVPHSDR